MTCQGKVLMRSWTWLNDKILDFKPKFDVVIE